MRTATSSPTPRIEASPAASAAWRSPRSTDTLLAMAGWTFRRRKGLCAACERAFADREPHFSMLWIEGEELVRSELCASCWHIGHASREQALFWWRTRHEEARRKGLA